MIVADMPFIVSFLILRSHLRRFVDATLYNIVLFNGLACQCFCQWHLRPSEIRSRGHVPRRLRTRSHLPLYPLVKLSSSSPAPGEYVLSSRHIMRGYHVKIRVTVQSTSTTATTTATARKLGRAAWTTDTHIPKSIFESLPSHTPRKTSRNHAILGSKRKDYRYGPIRIDWLDLNGSGPSFISGGTKTSAEGDTMDSVASGKERDPRVRGEGLFGFRPHRT